MKPSPSKASFVVFDLLGDPDSPGDGVGRELPIGIGLEGDGLGAGALVGVKASPKPCLNEDEKSLSKPGNSNGLVFFSFESKPHASPPSFKFTLVPPPILARPDL